MLEILNPMILKEFRNSKALDVYLDFLNCHNGYLTYAEKHHKLEQYLKNINNNSVVGKAFEIAVIDDLQKNNVLNLYYNTSVTFVPNVNFDIVLCKENQKLREPSLIILSLKTSLRERYKQAALEGYALKNVFRNSASFLLTHDNPKKQNEKIDNKEIIGIDRIIQTSEESYDCFLTELSKNNYIPINPVPIINNQKIIF